MKEMLKRAIDARIKLVARNNPQVESERIDFEEDSSDVPDSVTDDLPTPTVFPATTL